MKIIKWVYEKIIITIMFISLIPIGFLILINILFGLISKKEFYKKMRYMNEGIRELIKKYDNE